MEISSRNIWLDSSLIALLLFFTEKVFYLYNPYIPYPIYVILFGFVYGIISSVKSKKEMQPINIVKISFLISIFYFVFFIFSELLRRRFDEVFLNFKINLAFIIAAILLGSILFFISIYLGQKLYFYFNRGSL